MIKKEGLWNTMNVAKWELNQMEQLDGSRLYNDKPYAIEKMLFNESLILRKSEELLGHLYYKNNETFKETFGDIEVKYVKN